jgi:hypothetical protein
MVQALPITFETFKGENVQATLYKRKISTYINELNRAGFKASFIKTLYFLALIIKVVGTILALYKE